MLRFLWCGVYFVLSSAMVSVCGLPMYAHHSTAGYDLIHGTIVSGVVTGFNWENPHTHLLLDVAGETDTEHWSIEMEGPAGLSRLGWTKDTLRSGDHISVIGSRANDQTFRMRAGYIEWPDGRKLSCLPREN
jgi:Family of unknown function (DUF6152)